MTVWTILYRDSYGVGSLLTLETVQVEQSDTSVLLGVVNPKFAPYRFLI